MNMLRESAKHNSLSRELILNSIKSFFILKGFSEVSTPIVIKSPFPEPYIDAIPIGNKYYRTSPELHMKILLSKGEKKIFEIGPCYRKGESGKLHREQFTMLEWYEVGADYKTLLSFTQELLMFIVKDITGETEICYNGNIIDFSSQYDFISIDEAFAKFANITAEDALEKGLFEDLLNSKIEPKLSLNKPVVLIDYPAELAALAKLKSTNTLLAARWELYLAGIEIANTYTELTDVEEHKYRFAKFAKKRRELGAIEYPVDPEFLLALKEGIPDSAGCALGIDRLIMILTDSDSI